MIEQAGKIKVFENDPSVGNVQTFLNITSIVDQDPGYTEEGLLGLAFHPNFSENGYFYVNYTDYGPKRNVIARYTVSETNPNQADIESSFVILEAIENVLWNLAFFSEFKSGPIGQIFAFCICHEFSKIFALSASIRRNTDPFSLKEIIVIPYRVEASTFAKVALITEF